MERVTIPKSLMIVIIQFLQYNAIEKIIATQLCSSLNTAWELVWGHGGLRGK